MDRVHRHTSEDQSRKLRLSTKASTLDQLSRLLKNASVCKCVIFTVAEWNSGKMEIIDRIQRIIGPSLAIARSSSLSEDGSIASMAGAYDSVLNVDTTSSKAIISAVQRVIASYRDDGVAENQVLVQPMINDVSMSGVVFSHDLNTGAPYYVINYDDQSGLTDTVTSGSTDTTRTLLVYRNKASILKSKRFSALIRAVQEIEDLTSVSGLDIEFAVTKYDEIFVLQARPMAVSSNWNRDISHLIRSSLAEIERFLESRFRPRNGLLGDTSIFGEMPDWNPAEMIGTVPRPLAHSLYEYLITNSAWAEARAELGYTDMTGRPLMVSLGGRVFIDVRESFNSFLPANLPNSIGEKLINKWLTKLKSSPELHDKVEFDVAITAMSLSFDSEVASRHDDLNPVEIERFRSELLQLTDSIISGRVGGAEEQTRKLNALDRHRRETISDAKNSPLEAARDLLYDCIGNGTIPFAIMARRGFIAESMLRSIENLCILSSDRIAEFRSSVPTVLTDLLISIHSCQKDEKSWNSLMEAYGHLRPGTYDILATRYDQRQDLADVSIQQSLPESPPCLNFHLTPEETYRLDNALTSTGFSFDSNQLLQFMRESISGREYAKLAFTRNVSDALELISLWGEAGGLSRDELSYLRVEQIFRSLVATSQLPSEQTYREISKSAKEAYSHSQAICLPYLISTTQDIYVIPKLKSRPNFITSQRVHGQVYYLSDHQLDAKGYKGKIVLIERADPGYDWIFMESIMGLVTKYGGANSHMAIRCAELNIPAAIGCGEQIFDQAKQSTIILLDCAAGLILPAH